MRCGHTPELSRAGRGVGMTARPLSNQRKESLAAESEVQSVQGEGAALVEAIIKHEIGPGVSHNQVLRKLHQHRMVLGREVIRGGATARF